MFLAAMRDISRLVSTEARALNHSSFERANQISFFDDGAASDVDEKRASLHLFEFAQGNNRKLNPLI